MQVVYDAAYLAKGYAEDLLDEKLTAQGITGYKMDGTAYGFATSEIPYVFVSFLYSYGGKTETYGYKFNVNEGLEALPNIDKDTEIEYSNIFTIIDESVEIGEFSYPNN